jgi:hypothetical protein
VFNLDTKQKVKAFAMPELVAFWKWLTPTQLGLVTANAVFHWSTEVRAAVRGLGTDLVVWPIAGQRRKARLAARRTRVRRFLTYQALQCQAERLILRHTPGSCPVSPLTRTFPLFRARVPP